MTNQLSTRCPECRRIFDLRVEYEADEWYNGHDCETVADTLAEWKASGYGTVGVSGIDTLTRLAAHSIGCSTDDLRDSELDIIDAIVAAQVAAVNA